MRYFLSVAAFYIFIRTLSFPLLSASVFYLFRGGFFTLHSNIAIFPPTAENATYFIPRLNILTLIYYDYRDVSTPCAYAYSKLKRSNVYTD